MAVTRATINGTLNARRLDFKPETEDAIANTIVARDAYANISSNGINASWFHTTAQYTCDSYITAASFISTPEVRYSRIKQLAGGDGTIEGIDVTLSGTVTADTVSASAFSQSLIHTLIGTTPFWDSGLFNTSIDSDSSAVVARGTVLINFQTAQTVCISFGDYSNTDMTVTVELWGEENSILFSHDIYNPTKNSTYTFTVQDTADLKLGRFIAWNIKSANGGVVVTRVGFNWF